MSGIEVYDTYEEHGDWHKELAKQIAGLAVGFLVGAAACNISSFRWLGGRGFGSGSCLYG